VVDGPGVVLLGDFGELGVQRRGGGAGVAQENLDVVQAEPWLEQMQQMIALFVDPPANFSTLLRAIQLRGLRNRSQRLSSPLVPALYEEYIRSADATVRPRAEGHRNLGLSRKESPEHSEPKVTRNRNPHPQWFVWRRCEPGKIAT
jgi:hypothetical protein